MARKFIKKEEYQENIKPNEELTFSLKSPISSIRLPDHKTSFFAIHGNITCYGAQGTLYACRINNIKDQFPLNIQEYSFNSNQGDEEKTKIKGPLNPEYHHAPDIPTFLKVQAPEEIIKKVMNIRKIWCKDKRKF